MRSLHNLIASALTNWFFAVVLVLLLPFAVCLAQSAGSSAPAASDAKGVLPSATRSSPDIDNRYRIGPGDLITIITLDYAQLSSDARVDSKGMILLPMVEGEIEAACHTEGELAEKIAKRYLKYLKEPQVRVFVKEYQSQTVAVLGAVNSPGRFQLQRRVQLLELLTYVNGPSDKAGQNIQIIHTGSSPICESSPNNRDQNAEADFVTYKLKETLRAEAKANPFVQPGDIITVPEADQYFLMGNVARPAAYPIKEPISLTQAIVLAGGTLPDTKTDKVRIIRQASQNAPRTELVVDLKLIAKEQKREIMLEPNDIVEVPKQGGAAMAFKTALRGMLPMVTGMPIRVIRGY